MRIRVTLSSHCGPLYIPLSHNLTDRLSLFNRHSIWSTGIPSGAVAGAKKWDSLMQLQRLQTSRKLF